MNERRPINPLRLLDRPAWAEQTPLWEECKPGIIRAALARARARPSGGWYVIAASREVRPDRAFGRVVGGREVVAWRDGDGVLHAGPGACPHLGAALCDAPVHEGRLVCRWHGLALGPEGHRGWRTFPAHDDGVLAWVRLESAGEEPTDAPRLGPRPDPAHSFDAVATMIGRCEPEDVLANRLDPWHGAWFHPYSFANLRVVSAPPLDCPPAEDRFLVEVTFTLHRRVGVPVIAEFTCPDPRTITMEIVDGEGAGSVVETHATPLRPGPDGRPRTAVIEATIAHSDRPGFGYTRRVSRALRPAMELAARRLWRDDLDYAERRYALRTGH
ncbi:MAG: CrtV-methyltransferase-like protein [uncultured Pseudonocardia sp.]|uniref:CrtV-methyltransferase-like protein n=1 Tax=uncultured Pseudonocardia sp. TaxID=211455 RepID=A0A6J4QRZ4_9PSEU|nr:MAG: CrtV-methyltransferase-like protein [uncultured Pseudonocardia sp.]